MASISLNSGNHLLCKDVLCKVFDEVQSQDLKSTTAQQRKEFKEKLLRKIEKISDKVGKRVLAETLMRMMIVPFLVSSGKNPYVTELIDFFYQVISSERFRKVANDKNAPCSRNESLIQSSTSGSSPNDGNDSSDCLPLLILRQCEKHHDESRDIIRLRLLQCVEKILLEIINVSHLKANLIERLISTCMTRSMDIHGPIRVIAIRILSIFYYYESINPEHEKKIADRILDRMAHDPSKDVRGAAVSMIKVKDENYERIFERLGDQSAEVRTAALNAIAECIELSELTSEMREKILKHDSSDANQNVRNAMNNLLQKWLEALNEDVTAFLRILNVRKRVRLCRNALDDLFNHPPQDAFERIALNFLGENKYPEESLDPERTYLWLYLYKRFGDDPYVFGKLALSAVDMIDYIKEYIEVIEEEGNLSSEDLNSRSLMLGDLIQILCYLPREEGDRRAILDFLPVLLSKAKFMDSCNSSYVVKLVSICSDISSENILIDLVNGVLESARNDVVDNTDDDQEEEESWNFSDKTMLIAITMVKTYILFTNKISSFSRTFHDLYVAKAINHANDPIVRAQGLELMCMISFHCEADCVNTVVFCLTGLMRDNEEIVKISALNCLIDLILRYSIAKLTESCKVQTILVNHYTSNPPRLDVGNPAALLHQYLLSLINNSNIKLAKNAVEGMLKLLIKKKVSNSWKLIVSFLWKWAKPAREMKVRFKKVESTIPFYASRGEDEAVQVAISLIICARKLIAIRSCANSDYSPLPDFDQIVGLVVKATDPARLSNLERCYVGHETIANAAITELCKPKVSSQEKIQYAKLLKLLNLQSCPSQSLARIKASVFKIPNCDSKCVSFIISSFTKYLESLLRKDGVEVGNKNANMDDTVEIEDKDYMDAFDEGLEMNY